MKTTIPTTTTKKEKKREREREKARKKKYQEYRGNTTNQPIEQNSKVTR